MQCGGVRRLAAPLSPARKVALVGEVVGTYCQVRWWMRGRNFEELVDRLRDRESRDAVDRRDRDMTDLPTQRLSGLRLGRAVRRTLTPLPTDSRCLVQALVLTRLLGRRGVPCSLVIGVTVDPEFTAHAWVEHGGVPLLPAGSGFERLVEV